MQKKTLLSNSLLLLTAAIWGFAFVAQRVGGRYLGSFTFNGVRFTLGSLSLVPLIVFYGRRAANKRAAPKENKSGVMAGIAAGSILFAGASLQQLGMVKTNAGKAAFITGLYLVLVPVLGIFLKRRLSLNKWVAAVIALSGLYLLCVTQGYTVETSDMLLLAGSLFWAFHILIIDHYAKLVDILKLSFVQFATCSVLSMAAALLFEKITFPSIIQAGIPILYGGICSVGIAYTLQVIGQKNAEPSHAAIIMSMESVFAVLGGYILLNEELGLRGIAGCVLMLAGMLLSQVDFKPAKKGPGASYPS